MKKKFRLTNKKRFFSFLFVLLVTGILAGSVAAAAENGKIEYRTVTVMPGDTLWDIAQDNSGNTDIRKYVYDLKKVNQLESATIYAGQKLYLP